MYFEPKQQAHSPSRWSGSVGSALKNIIDTSIEENMLYFGFATVKSGT